MGGFGSGRPRTRSLGRVETIRALEIGKLNRCGALRDGWSGSWIWSNNAKETARIGMHMRAPSLHLNYKFRRDGGEWELVDQRISIEWHPCRFGGHRPYFRCPGGKDGRACHRSVTRLYGAGKYFCCRHCYQLNYGSQHEDRWDRALRRANKIRIRLGGEPGMASVFPSKPKRMRHATYDRLLEQVSADEGFAEGRLELFAARLMKLGTSKPRQSGRRSGYW